MIKRGGLIDFQEDYEQTETKYSTSTA